MSLVCHKVRAAQEGGGMLPGVARGVEAAVLFGVTQLAVAIKGRV